MSNDQDRTGDGQQKNHRDHLADGGTVFGKSVGCKA